MYDGIFNINMSEGVTIIGLADIAIVVTAWTQDELQDKANTAVELAVD